MREGAEGGAGGEGGSHSYGGVANGMDWRPRRWFTTGWTARERFWVDSKCYLCLWFFVSINRVLFPCRWMLIPFYLYEQIWTQTYLDTLLAFLPGISMTPYFFFVPVAVRLYFITTLRSVWYFWLKKKNQISSVFASWCSSKNFFSDGWRLA